MLGCAAVALILPACSKGPAVPMVAVGKLGSGLSAHAGHVPQGATVCAYKRALEDPRSKEKTSFQEACKDATKSDELWTRAMDVLAAYSENLVDLGSGTDPETTGHLAAEMTGVSGPDWIEVGGDETAARDAVWKLVEQLAARHKKTDLQEAVKIAAPHVKTICTGLDAYLERQTRDLDALQKALEETRVSPTTRRCAVIDNRSFCVSDSVVDSVGYANALGHMAVLENRHARAKEAMGGFCAGHAKLAEAAEKGDAADEETYPAVVEAVKGARN